LVDGVWVRGVEQATSVLDELECDAEMARVSLTRVVGGEGGKKSGDE